MRAVKRAARAGYARLRIAPRRREVQAEIAQELGGPVTLERAGARGRDSIYRVRRDGRLVAVLRLANPHKERAAPEGQPFVLLEPEARLAREWGAYAAGAEAGLTPKPLWRAPDAILCAAVPGTRLSDLLFADRGRFWDLMRAVTPAIRRLHDLGVVHMDMSLANVIRGDGADGDRLTFVDFEYAPAPGLGLAEQRAYDHLRLVESSIKFLPPGAADGGMRWIATLDAHLDDVTRTARLAPIGSGLTRLLAHPALGPAVRGLFPAAP